MGYVVGGKATILFHILIYSILQSANRYSVQKSIACTGLQTLVTLPISAEIMLFTVTPNLLFIEIPSQKGFYIQFQRVINCYRSRYEKKKRYPTRRQNSPCTYGSEGSEKSI
jgi:hypothetical protein